jgi:DNA polymerase I
MKKFTQLDAADLMLRGSVALAKIEANGIAIDEAYLDHAIAKAQRRIKRVEERLKGSEVFAAMRKRFGGAANLDSNQQIGKALFEDMGFEAKRFTAKTRKLENKHLRRPSTDAESLGQIDHPFVRDWIALKEWKKAEGTYLRGIKRETVGGFIHPMYSLNTVTSFRGSSSLVNFQNQPRGGYFGEMIRRCFVPRPGNVMAEVDFGAHEFKVAAAVWRDPKMIAYATDPKKDIHKDMAAKICCCRKDDVSKDMRYEAKSQVVFPKLYGSYYLKMTLHVWETVVGKFSGKGDDAGMLDKEGNPVKGHWAAKGMMERGRCVPKERPERGTLELHMKEVEDWWDRKFSHWVEAKEKAWREYQQRGWYDMVTGFRVNGVFSKNFFLNSHSQGPGFHILLEVLIRVDKELRKRKFKALLIGTIHDCLLMDVPPEELQDVLNLVKRVMTVDVPRDWDWICVPLQAEVDCSMPGESWWDKKVWEEKNGTWVPKAA